MTDDHQGAPRVKSPSARAKLAVAAALWLALSWAAVPAPAPAVDASSPAIAPPDTVIDSTFSERGDYRTFRFYASSPGSTFEPGATFECSLDGAAAEPCSSPHTYRGLADGRHSLAVRASVSGVADPTPDSIGFRVDTKLSNPWIRMRETQRQQGTMVAVKVRAGAGEAGSMFANGAVKIGGQSFNLKKEFKRITAGERVQVRLVAQKRREAKRIHRLLDRGKRPRAYIRAYVSDEFDNLFRRSQVVRLR